MFNVHKYVYVQGELNMEYFASQDRANVNTVLSDIQRELKAPKNQFNKFGNYKYRSCEDILEGIKKVIPEGAAILLTDSIIAIGDRVYVEAKAILSFGGEHIFSKGYARESVTKKGMDESQITGATSSYARKYALNGLFAIDDTKDADSYEPKVESKKDDNEQKMSKEVYSKLKYSLEQCDEKGLLKEGEVSSWRDKLGIGSIYHLEDKRALALIAKLEERLGANS
jgi:hypothetical protein